MHGTDADDVTTSLDFFVVAADLASAKDLWEKAVLDTMERDPEDGELESVFVIVEDASALPVASKGARVVTWDELDMPWRKTR